MPQTVAAPPHLRQKLVSTRYLIGKLLRIHALRDIGLFGLLHQCGDVNLQLLLKLSGSPVADALVLARVTRGAPTTTQLVSRRKGNQWYVNFPSALAKAMAFKKGEVVEWTIETRDMLNLHRTGVLNRITQRISTDADATGAIRKDNKRPGFVSTGPRLR